MFKKFLGNFNKNFFKNSIKSERNDEDDLTATQGMIEDSRARRELGKATLKTQFECEMCPYRSGSKNLMGRHKKTHQEIRFTCDKCEFRSGQKSKLEEHVKSVHEKNKYACEQCEYMSEQKDDVKRHREMIHETKRVETSIQGEVFESNLGTGMIEAGAPSKSYGAGKTSEEKRKGKQNSKYIHKRINCELCEKKFNKKERFELHMAKIHKRNPVGMGAAV